ncbi:MAG TPA: hypothetical protein VHG08_10260 [Longimicrobium sp.]|nr:hypothetical protein [Longimicrobium sp.]
MKISAWTLLLGAGLLSGCGSTYGGIPIPGGPSGDVIVVGDRDRDDRDRDERGGYRARSLGVPRGHYPPPGECRVWYPGREPGQQPPPAKCDRLAGRVPYGAFILYNGQEWDTRYDWPEHERRNRGSVPGVILNLMRSLSR